MSEHILHRTGLPRTQGHREHGGRGDAPTATELMEDEHAKAMQLAAVTLNFLGLVFRLPDERSAMIVLDAALEQGKNLIELLRLHVFREDNIVFPLAHRLIAGAEFDSLQARAVTSSWAASRQARP